MLKWATAECIINIKIINNKYCPTMGETLIKLSANNQITQTE